MYATKENPTANWSFQKIDKGSQSSTGNAIISDIYDIEHIAYYHVESGELRYTMNYSGSWPHETIDKLAGITNNYLRNVDIIDDREEFIHIVYEDNDNLFYATTRVEIPSPNIVLSPGHLAFGTVDTGRVTADSLYIRNGGVLDLHISDIRIT